MATFKRLLAKSSKTPDAPKDYERLSGHTAAVMNAADQLLEARLDASLEAVGFSRDAWRARTVRMVRLAALLHDLGKANDQFQSLVRGKRAIKQAMRHEAVSLWLSWPGQPLSDWLRSAVETDDDYLCAVMAAAAHHRKFWSDSFASIEDGAGVKINLLTSHADFSSTLKLAQRLGLREVPKFTESLVIRFAGRFHPEREFRRWETSSAAFRHGDLARVLGLVKALVLAADIAGSSLPLTGQGSGWIATSLAERSVAAEFDGLIARRLKGNKPREFQEAVGSTSAPVTLIRAGCGSGKTVGAYLWAKTQHPTRRFWFTYPTTGTATEGFRDYLFGADIETLLEHGRAKVDAEVFHLYSTRGDGNGRDRLDAIRAWRSDAVTCTVDTVLGLIQNHRKGMYAWPSLAHSAVVFDEVHAYDQGLFNALLHFLSAFPGIPTLLMTASLPEERLQILRATVQQVHQRELAEISGPERMEILPRYRRYTANDPWPAVAAALETGKKVLWVSNTVRRCMQTACQAQEREIVPFIYHSRFRYVDRLHRHAELIAAFDPAQTPEGMLAVTTQVAEMSLDVSADLLITDLAPIASLIQRLGRLNRRSTPEAARAPMPFIVVPFEGQPYADDELGNAARWLDILGERDLSQRDLVEAWKPEAILTRGPQAPSAFREGGFCTVVGDLREPTPGITVLLERDVERIRRGEASSEALALPMGVVPKGFDHNKWKKLEFYPIAPEGAIGYDSERGGEWRS